MPATSIHFHLHINLAPDMIEGVMKKGLGIAAWGSIREGLSALLLT